MSRNRLHVNKIDDFKAYLESNGWINQKTKSCWEELRMSHDDYNMLIVHKKMNAKVHCTLNGESEYWFSKYMAHKKASLANERGLA